MMPDAERQLIDFGKEFRSPLHGILASTGKLLIPNLHEFSAYTL